VVAFEGDEHANSGLISNQVRLRLDLDTTKVMDVMSWKHKEPARRHVKRIKELASRMKDPDVVISIPDPPSRTSERSSSTDEHKPFFSFQGTHFQNPIRLLKVTTVCDLISAVLQLISVANGAKWEDSNGLWSPCQNFDSNCDHMDVVRALIVFSFAFMLISFILGVVGWLNEEFIPNAAALWILPLFSLIFAVTGLIVFDAVVCSTCLGSGWVLTLLACIFVVGSVGTAYQRATLLHPVSHS